MKTFTSSTMNRDKMLNQRAMLRDKVLFRLLKTKGKTVCDICEKLKYNTRNVSVLSDEELCELWYQVKLILEDAQQFCIKKHDSNVVPKEYSMIIQLIRIITSMAHETILRKPFIPDTLLEVVITLHSVILPQTEDKRIKNEISFFLENWWKTNMMLKEKVIINVLKYLIQGAETSAKFLKRLLDIKSALYLTKGTECAKALLQLVRKKYLLTLDEGRELISYLFTLGESWVVDVHSYIKVMLETTEHNQIAHYSNIYATAWAAGTPATKKFIVEHCIQDFIFHALRTQRFSTERCKLGKHLLIFLNALHKHQNRCVKKMMYDQYKSLLWEHLKAPGSTIRSNAADILFAAYPMQDVCKTRGMMAAYVRQQHSAMRDLLNDQNPDVCIAALRGMATLLKKQWKAVPSNVIQEWLNILLGHSRKTPHAKVRLSVFFALREVMHNADSHSTLKQFLPKFANSIYDDNVCVTEALLKLLRYIQNNTEISCSEVVPVCQLLECLNRTEESPMLQILVELLLRNAVSLNVCNDDAVKELVDIGLNNLNAMRKLLLHSKHVIDWNTSVELIKYVLSMIETEVETSCVRTDVRRAKRLKTCNARTTETAAVSQRSEDDESVPDERTFVLLDIVATLLVAAQKDIESSDNAKEMENVLSIISNTLPKLYDHFQEPLAKQTLTFMFSLISPSSLSDDEGLQNKFLAELRCSDVKVDTIHTIIHVLSKWERLNMVLELLAETLKSVTTDGLSNKSNRNGFYLSVRILKCLLKAEFQSALADEHYNELLELWKILHALRNYIEQQCDGNEEVRGNIEFNKAIIDCFNEYVRILSLLHKPDVFDTPKQFSDLLNWAQRKVCSHAPKSHKVKENEFSVSVLRVIFRNCHLLLKRLYVTPKLCCNIVLFYAKCIQLPCGIVFTRDYLTAMTALLEYSKVAYANKECNLLNVVMPNMLSAQMIRLITYSEDVILKHTNELRMLTSVVHKYYSVTESCSKEQDRHIPYMTIMFNAAVSCISKEVFKQQKFHSKRTNILKQKLPYLADKILKILLYTRKYRALCVQILEKAVIKYTQIDLLSALMIIDKMLKMSLKIHTVRLHNVVLSAKSRNQVEPERLIHQTINTMIKAILE